MKDPKKLDGDLREEIGALYGNVYYGCSSTEKSLWAMSFRRVSAVLRYQQICNCSAISATAKRLTRSTGVLFSHWTPDAAGALDSYEELIS